MATVSQEMAESIIAADGYYPGDPRCTKVLRYTNDWGNECYALVWPHENQMRYEESSSCSNVVVLWEAS
jgi:hypothetical protein